MNKFRLTIKLFVIATFVFAFASVAQAQATRTWVSGVGDDANPCSRTAPCKTFAGAISKTATAGEINVLDPGGFGGVTITKSITISSEGFEAGVLVSGTNAILINAPVDAVVILRGLDIEGLGTGLNGIDILQGRTVIVEDCTIHGFRAASTNGFGIKDRRTQGGVDIPMLFVKNCEIRNNRVGIGATTASAVLLRGIVENTRIHRNTSHGAQIQQGAVYSFRQCNISGNAGSGVRAENASQVVLISSILTNNQGIAADNGGTGAYSLADVTITNNVTSHAGTITTFGNNNCRNNANNVGTNCALGAPVGQT